MNCLFEVAGMSKQYGKQLGCENISFSLYPGEVLGIVGESGSGKSTVLNCLSGQLEPDEGEVYFDSPTKGKVDIWTLTEAEQRHLARTEWAFVHQNPRDGLRMGVSWKDMAISNLNKLLSHITDKSLWVAILLFQIAGIDDGPRIRAGGL